MTIGSAIVARGRALNQCGPLSTDPATLLYRGTLSPQAVQHGPSLDQVHRAVAAREPALDRREQRARVIDSSDIPPDLRRAGRGPQFEQSRILPPRRCQSTLEQRPPRGKRCGLGQPGAGSYAKPFRLAVMLPGCVSLGRCPIQQRDSLIASLVLQQDFGFADPEQGPQILVCILSRISQLRCSRAKPFSTAPVLAEAQPSSASVKPSQ